MLTSLGDGRETWLQFWRLAYALGLAHLLLARYSRRIVQASFFRFWPPGWDVVLAFAQRALDGRSKRGPAVFGRNAERGAAVACPSYKALL